MGRDRAHELEAERGPVVLVVPDQHRREHDQCNQRRRPGIGAEQPAPPPVRHQRKRHHRRQQHDRGEFRQQRQPGEQPGGEPPARIAAFMEPDQRPQHRDRERDHRRVGRHLRHQQPVIKRGLRHQQREHQARKSCVTRRTMSASRSCVTSIATMPPNRTPRLVSPKIAVPNRIEPGDPRRMIEKGQHALLRPGPVIGLVGAQLDDAGIDQPHRRHRGDHATTASHPGAAGAIQSLAIVGGVRHGAFSWTFRGGVNVSRRKGDYRDRVAGCSPSE